MSKSLSLHSRSTFHPLAAMPAPRRARTLVVGRRVHGLSGAVADACATTGAIVEEMTAVVSAPAPDRGLPRRTVIHRRQIAMYVAHVVLRLSMSDIGVAFGRDRSTVSHACNAVEDRRDDPGYDRFVAAVERVVAAVFFGKGAVDGR